MGQRPTKTIAVRPAEALASARRLTDALERAFPVRFVAWREDVRCDAVIAAGSERPPHAVLPTLLLTDGHGAGASEDVTIHATPAVDRRLHGLQLAGVAAGAALNVEPDEQVLASGAGGAAWTRAGTVDRVRSPLPALAAGEGLRDARTADRVLGWLAVIEMLRRLTADIGHTPPPLRATMLFDDPNLRWRSYGFLNYADLVRHADQHGYHAAMAMIPLDAWRPHPSTVELFRRRPDRLSLAIHGNDHRVRELFDQHDPRAALALGVQALRRVARFEASSGLRVGRIMVPPHGMCSQTMARALGQLPFDALCSIHPFPWTGSPPERELLAGWGPASFPEGCAVIPRTLFDTPATELALRAYMDHPIVLYGHHDDVADGLDLLAEAAARTNRLGHVEWVSPEQIALGNAALRRDGDVLSVRPYARRVRLAQAASIVTVDAPCDGLAGWSLGAGSEIHPFCAPVAAGGGPLEIRLRSCDEVEQGRVRSPSSSLWPRMRRVATESRDRLAPLVRRGG